MHLKSSLGVLSAIPLLRFVLYFVHHETHLLLVTYAVEEVVLLFVKD